MTDYKKLGKANRAAGKRFEIKTREDLEEKGWIVFRNSNNVEFVKVESINGDNIAIPFGQTMAKFKQSKSSWNPYFNRAMMTQSGFPDFIAIKPKAKTSNEIVFEVIFVECKINGYLSKEEKAKVTWIKNNLFIPVSVAKRGKKRGEIEYLHQ